MIPLEQILRAYPVDTGDLESAVLSETFHFERVVVVLMREYLLQVLLDG